MKKILLGLFVLFFIASCGKKETRINYANQNKKDTLTIDKMVKDTSKMLVADFPINFDSTAYLIHPVGFVNLKAAKETRAMSIGSSSDNDDTSFSAKTYRGDIFSGNISNLIFEDINSGKQKLLTNKVLKIQDIEYLRPLAHKIHRQYLIYTVIDSDTNGDGVLDDSDIVSLYISYINGSGFKKVTVKNYKYLGSKLIIQNSRCYFKTVEDTNKDGLFSQADTYHYNYIDFSGKDYNFVEYFPLDLIRK